ncbi:hypothetical protein ACLB2K_016616 [Fragaria x ananassa]
MLLVMRACHIADEESVMVVQKGLKRIKAPTRFEKEQSYSQYKCNITAFQDLVFKIYGKLKAKERRLLREVLKKTSFWNLLYDKGLMKKTTTKKSDKDVHIIVQCYDKSLKKFRFGKHLAEISVSDVHYILGLPISGLIVPNPKDGSRKPIDNPIVQRFFAEEKRIERAKIMSCINAELDNEESPERIENIAILMILHMFIMQLFASAGSKLGWSFVKCIVDMETMNKYNWAKSVRDYLLFCLNTAKKGQTIQINECTTLIPIDNAVVEKRRNIYAAKENSDDDFEDPQLKIQPKKRKMEVKKEKVGVAVRRNKIEKKAKVTVKKSNKNKKKNAAKEVQEDVADQFMEIATKQV